MRVLTGWPPLIVAGTLLLAGSGHAGTAGSIKAVQQSSVSGQCADQQAFRAEIQSDSERAPRSIVTNLCEVPLTAFFLENFSPKDGKPSGGLLWDAFLQNTSPIAKDENVSLPPSHVVGQPFPDKIQVVAAIWADGSIFGDPARLKLILASRAGCEKSYDSAVSLLQKGLQQNWTRAQYIEALDQRKKEAPLSDVAGQTMESSLTRNPSLDSPAHLERTVRYLVEIFTQRRATLRQTKPQLDVATSSN